MLSELLRRNLLFIKLIGDDCEKVIDKIQSETSFSYPTKARVDKHDIAFIWMCLNDGSHQFYIGHIRFIEYRTIFHNVFIHNLINIDSENKKYLLILDIINNIISNIDSEFAIKLDKNQKKNFLHYLYDISPKEIDCFILFIKGIYKINEQEKLRRIALRNLMNILDVKDKDISKVWRKDNREITIYEDKIVARDAIQIPGFEKLETSITGKTEFIKRNEKISVYSTNKTLVEEAFGVDLIYINENHRSIIMIQYKMLKYESDRWIYRVDDQFRKEIERMSNLQKYLLNNIRELKEFDDYRLNPSPFYLKFIKSKTTIEQEPPSFTLSLDHFNSIKELDICKGIRDGVIRIDYDILSGRYLRSSNFIDLINSGYVGSYRIESDLLQYIIDELAQGNRDFLIAWKEKIN
ncbi:hypothetical protein NYR30_04035 [Gallibacterium salpingitidis]|uniref:hypothetical protein n=1 Tax=Gallibacterium salpingitidis TaxID=505341 RepID=UPI00266F42A7|nr:hypothetical protein [Gallibacterium salpingitidis]WKT00468.1 hypothetical protein NYR30_04035 [Gallibacterium salpingitidis]